MSSAKVTAEKVGGQFVKAYYQAVQNVEKKRLISFYNVVRSVPLFRLRSSPTHECAASGCRSQLFRGQEVGRRVYVSGFALP